jgi:hypothetical protein
VADTDADPTSPTNPSAQDTGPAAEPNEHQDQHDDEHDEDNDEDEDFEEDDPGVDFDSEDGPENPLRIPDERTLEDLLRHFATQDSPRLFALCAVAKGWRRAEITAWGMSFADQAVVYLPGERSVGFFTNAQRAAEMFGMGRDVRLIWPDFVPLREMTTT